MAERILQGEILENVRYFCDVSPEGQLEISQLEQGQKALPVG